MARIYDMHGGKGYDADLATRMKGSGPWANLVRQRFDKASKRLSFNVSGSNSTSASSGCRQRWASPVFSIEAFTHHCGQLTTVRYVFVKGLLNMPRQTFCRLSSNSVVSCVMAKHQQCVGTLCHW